MNDRDAPADDECQGNRAVRFRGERRTTTGRFSGTGDRLVHVRPDGALRDFGYPLSGLSGIERSRFGLRVEGDVVRFEECENAQRYVGETVLVATIHRTPIGDVTRLDLTHGRAHLTRFDLSELADDASELAVLASVEFAPDGRADRVGQLRFSDAVDVYHAREHDFLASDPGFAGVRSHFDRPDGGDAVEGGDVQSGESERYEEERLSRSIATTIVPDDDAITLASLLTDRTETPRDRARERLGTLLERFDNRETFERAASDLPATAGERPSLDPSSLPDGMPRRDGAVDDLRALSLLSAPTGLRIAGPDFDPAYRHSGGYGYTWFRDDAEISGFLLSVDDAFGLEFDSRHRRNAEMYCRTQLPDGTWPHRVWPVDGSLAPGWANSRIETGQNDDYQADQTASVVSFLSRLRDRLDPDDDAGLASRVDDALSLALDGLDATLVGDGRPVACQNAWEDAVGRFSHTAATFLQAYASVAAAESVDADLGELARERTELVYAGIDDLWVPDRETYAVCETLDGDLDRRLDSASLALAGAHRAYDRLARVDDGVAGVDDDRLDRLVSHADGVLQGLYRDPDGSPVEGLVRYEGDRWRRGDQPAEKVWTVSTAWGANAAAELSALLTEREDPRADGWGERACELLSLVEPDGPLAEPTGYLPEQVFDDGTPDSATPLGWPHAIRLSTRALLAEQGRLSVEDAE